MAAYSFQRQFIAPIEAGTNLQTIRAVGKRRHAILGGMLQLYFGMRTTACRKIIPDPVCTRLDRVRLNLGLRTVVIGADGGPMLTSVGDLDRFGVLDGFENWAALDAFWAQWHPDHRFFDGVMPGWGPAFWNV